RPPKILEGSCLLVVFSLTAVSCQVQVEGFPGGEVLLPCIYRRGGLPQGGPNVFWRDKDDSIVLDIKANKADTSLQNKKFTGRVETFPEFYPKGNFSIVIKKLQEADSGPYECNIPAVDYAFRVKLTVSGRRVAMTTPRPGPAGGAAEGLSSILLTLLSVLLSARHVL
uniref:Ig-like domain-containing protein n=1 Tax=Mastacembelus armatus TaxID=205130 RepID=A0A7N8X2T5_9TELE